ncbi:hypothetical protein EVAR_95084_1 [Eumeta japonica]|uniref:Uncharacterized protein n=1 Tax=Eumeta variegata TaxID=151549 RepID=A0A4C1W7W5_EUMVA|nr:hypothetical protein EVAR_95084_1 [Eumeta japonica]
MSAAVQIQSPFLLLCFRLGASSRTGHAEPSTSESGQRQSTAAVEQFAWRAVVEGSCGSAGRAGSEIGRFDNPRAATERHTPTTDSRAVRRRHTSVPRARALQQILMESHCCNYGQPYAPVCKTAKTFDPIFPFHSGLKKVYSFLKGRKRTGDYTLELPVCMGGGDHLVFNGPRARLLFDAFP